MSLHDQIRSLYQAFNDRRLDDVVAALHPQVDWPNGWEGGRIRGREAVRDYWQRQWRQIDPTVYPTAFLDQADGRVAVIVHQIVRDRSGALLADGLVEHVYRFDRGLVRVMEIRRAG